MGILNQTNKEAIPEESPWASGINNNNRYWAEEDFGGDVSWIEWSKDGKRLFVETSGVYGTGKKYILDLCSKKYHEVQKDNFEGF